MPSIYEAEIRHKPAVKTVEDQLTSRVFGALAMLPEDKVLLPFLRCLADVLAPQEKATVLSKLKSSQPRISLDLWKYIGTNYPDVYIELDDTVLVLEVKKGSKPDDDQITEQYENIKKKWLNRKNGGPRFIYFLLTKHYTEPDEVASARKKLHSWAETR